jgi:hypothetical protein
LAQEIWATIDPTQFHLIIEPTFGLGSFLKTIPEAYRGNVIGWEIDRDYFEVTRAKLESRNLPYQVHLTHGDVFELRPTHFPTGTGTRILVIGNPPWVTNAEQSTMGGKNTGKKRNLKSLKRLEALTGKANFDISEAIILHLANILKTCHLAQFAFLGKFTILRNLIQFIGPSPYVGDFEYHKIDSAKHFGASVDAGLIKFTVSVGMGPAQTCRVYESINSETSRQIAILNNRLIYDVERYDQSLFTEHRGPRHYVWRQGIKHDVRDILELTETAEYYFVDTAFFSSRSIFLSTRSALPSFRLTGVGRRVTFQFPVDVCIYVKLRVPRLFDGENREAGEIPARSRHCDARRSRQSSHCL